MDRACTAPGRASASRAALRSPWPSPATAVRGFPSSRSHSPVHILRGRATQKPSTPRYLGAPYLAGGGWFSRQLLCTSPSLTSCQRATAAVRGITDRTLASLACWATSHRSEEQPSEIQFRLH